MPPSTENAPEILVANFSGGRSSGMMVAEHLAAGGAYDHVLFANTGLESPETYEFLDWFSANVVPVTVVEYQGDSKHEVVGTATMKRDGTPMRVLIKERNRLPDMLNRTCTQNLKVKTIMRHLYDLHGHDMLLTTHIGFRADETPRRIVRMREQNEAFETRLAEGKRPLRWTGMLEAPLVARDVGRQDVLDYWKRVDPALSFDISDPDVRLSNCVGCFYGNATHKVQVAQKHPWFADFWEEMERTITTPKRTPISEGRTRWIMKHLNRPVTERDHHQWSIAHDHTWKDIKERARLGDLAVDNEVPYAGGCSDGYCNTD